MLARIIIGSAFEFASIAFFLWVAYFLSHLIVGAA
jgi:hypothetical protein